MTKKPASAKLTALEKSLIIFLFLAIPEYKYLIIASA
jgi:hypothetical protein